MPSPTVPFVTLPNWVKAAAQCGFNVEPVFRELGVDTDWQNIESARVSATAIDQAMEICVARAQGAYFPFVLGETFAFEYLSDLETFITTSRSLREASRALGWLREFVNPLMELQLHEAGRVAWLRMATRPGVVLKRYYSEAVFASVMKFSRSLVGQEAGFRQIHFRAPAPAPDVDYAGFFRLPVHFGQSHDGIAIDRALLDQPLKGDFPALHEQAEKRIARQLADTSTAGPVAEAVLQALAADPAQRLAEVATALALHPRQLQRRLQAEGSPFAALQDRARFEAAVATLAAGPTNIEALSETLGFSDRRSFSRAFKRWTGVAPSAYRRGKGKLSSEVPLRHPRS